MAGDWTGNAEISVWLMGISSQGRMGVDLEGSWLEADVEVSVGVPKSPSFAAGWS